MIFLSNLISSFNNIIGYILISVLIVAGLYFTFRTKFVQISQIKEMFRLLGDGFSSSDEKVKHKVSSFQAFCISTASRVGTGNLAGVAIAVSVGGPGAVFWMWLIALIGAASSFVECTLAQIFKVKDADSFRGGPAYYMQKALKSRNLGIIFSIIITITYGLVFNSVQSNTISIAFSEAFNVNKYVIAVLITLLTLAVIFGGVKRIAKVSEILVPILAVSYILIALFIIGKNYSMIPHMFNLIFTEAFNLKPAIGGTLGGVIMIGIKRGLFSNEAGMGSAPNAAATADVTHPAKQGLIQTLGVFIDTLIICSCTAFIILLSGVHTDKSLTGIQLTQNAINSQIGILGTYFVAICVLLFGFSSIVGNYYYGESNIEFITEKKIFLTIYRVLVIVMVFIGAVASLNLVWDMADLFMSIMALINLAAITLLGKYAFEALKDYKNQKAKGIKEPVFHKDAISFKEDLEGWN
ncbi:alanine/glycine:cation symporter family protein [Inconstantimicrobium porci]|uniref:Alanine:cation symporter family protein n=1 Tax=Inconstantimicrobium porci TaxID=2652291 RepID=A0A7X2T2N5_9CLOT|nr:alanine/glycine:cation symporter family protein [Inconstantimicrobium porci]MDD6770364.1 alanine/glycine:cation symporter family protein [Inconstantimicrobium porci]MSR92133.1 alanine:cation symporter family protein [Inconstantimicrobium porci]